MYGWLVLARYVLRFAPFTLDGLARSAQKQYDYDLEGSRVPPRWGVSAFAGTPREGENVDLMVERICREAPANGRQVAVGSARDLEEAGYRLHDDEPPAGHVLIGDDELTQGGDFDELARLWSSQRRRNPGFRKDG